MWYSFSMAICSHDLNNIDKKTSQVFGTGIYLIQKANNIFYQFIYATLVIFILTIFVLIMLAIVMSFQHNFYLLLENIYLFPAVIFIAELYVVYMTIVAYIFNCNYEIFYDTWNKKLIVNGNLLDIDEITYNYLSPNGITFSHGVVAFCIISFKVKDKIYNTFHIGKFDYKEVLNSMSVHTSKAKYYLAFIGIVVITLIITLIAIFCRF